MRKAWFPRRLLGPLLLAATPLLLAAAPEGLQEEQQAAEAQGPQVKVVLFFSPTCPHCHDVMENSLPPIKERFGEQLLVALVNVSTQQGQQLYRAAAAQYRLGPDRSGVPMMVVGDTVLFGSFEIPTLLPDLVVEGLARGGIDWPPIPGLRAMLAGSAAASSGPRGTGGSEAVTTRAAVTLSAMDRFRLDPKGNGLAVVVLVGMLGTLAIVGSSLLRPGRPLPDMPRWLPLVLAVAGLGVAGYLTYVEMTGSDAVCGPVGDCNTVQQSSYARLFGVAPVGLLGLVGYIAMLGAWALATVGPARFRIMSRWALLGMAAFGTVLSIYLTFLEPFVIGATCMWCLSSAVIVTAILVTAAGPRLNPRAALRE